MNITHYDPFLVIPFVIWQGREVKVREAFQILTQGVEMVHYDVRAGRGPTKNKKIVWMVLSQFLVLCVPLCS